MDANHQLIDGGSEREKETTALVMNATTDDMVLIKELGLRYGTPYFIEVVRLACRDALAHFDCQLHRRSHSKNSKKYRNHSRINKT